MREGNQPLEPIGDVERLEEGELQEVGAVVDGVEIESAQMGVPGVDGIEQFSVAPLGLITLTVAEPQHLSLDAGQIRPRL